jgi:hypothetical protein
VNDDTTDWRALREFKAVDLTQSFVLAWSVESGSLLIDVDLYLCPDHTLYEEPRPAEKACYRPASIDFPHCESATDSPTRGHLVDSVIKFRPGKVHGLKRTGEGHYEISGEFGTVSIRAERPMVRLKNL